MTSTIMQNGHDRCLIPHFSHFVVSHQYIIQKFHSHRLPSKLRVAEKTFFGFDFALVCAVNYNGIGFLLKKNAR